VPHEVWVVANFKETQLTHMRPGQPVQIKVDAYPQTTLRGRVDSIQAGSGARFSLLPPENASGNYVKVVQRFPVKIALDEPAGFGNLLGPGMSVTPRVRVN
jgi:membrane fusion protein (multidrug efflux system)